MDTLTGESQIVSKAMMAQNPLETPNALFWDGFAAYTEGQQLDELPTRWQQAGWWSALSSQAECEMPVVIVNGVDVGAELGDLVEAREDEDYLRSWH